MRVLGRHPALGCHPGVAERVAPRDVGEPEALDEVTRIDRLLVDLDPLADAHHTQVGVVAAQPALDVGRRRGDDEQRVRGAHVGPDTGPQRLVELLGELGPWRRRLG
jgi:hypothetical protein